MRSMRLVSGTALGTAAVVAALAALAALAAPGLLFLVDQQANAQTVGGPAPEDTPAATGDQARPLVDPVQLRDVGLRPYWRARIVLLARDEVRHVRLLGDHLVLLTNDNMCYSVATAHGLVRPLCQIAAPAAGDFAPPTYDGVHYFFAGKQKVIGVQAATGQVDMEMKLEMPASVRAISDKEFVYTGALDGRLFAFGLQDQVRHWVGKTGGGVTSIDFSRGQLIVVRCDPKKTKAEVLAIRPQMWVENWQQFTDGTVSAPIVCTDEAIFVASEDGSLYRFNAERGWSDWRVRTPGALVDAPILLGDRIIQIVPGTGTWVVGKAKGEVLWKDPAKLRFLSKAGARLYFFDGKNIVAKNADTGKTLGSAEVRDPSRLIAVPNLTDAKAYLLDQSGEAFCFNDISQPYLVVNQDGTATTKPN